MSNIKEEKKNSPCLRLGKRKAYMMAFTDAAQENSAL